MFDRFICYLFPWYHVLSFSVIQSWALRFVLIFLLVFIHSETSGNVRKTGGNFKEKFREHGGLDVVFDVARTCHSNMEVWACMFVGLVFSYYIKRSRVELGHLKLANCNLSSHTYIYIYIILLIFGASIVRKSKAIGNVCVCVCACVNWQQVTF